MAASLTSLGRRFGLRQHAFRAYLTAVYGGLFLLSGTGLLALTYWLADTRFPVAGRSSDASASPAAATGPGAASGGRPASLGLLQPQPQAGAAEARAQAAHTKAAALHSLLMMSGVALALMAVISIGLGWLVAGRMLRPLRMVTAAARRISASNLDERLAMTGPDDELKELGDTFDDLLGRLERAFDAQRQFVANASHELRTPLARLRALIETALDDQERTVMSLERACQRALVASGQQERLIDALLTLARSQAGLAVRGPVELAGVVDEVLRAREPEASKRELRLCASLAHAPALGDLRLIERLAVNLVANAIAHNVPDGWIKIATGVRDGRATLSIANAGVVVPATAVSRLFEPFQRLDASRTAGDDGLGLGLSIVRAIAEIHDARISAHARPGGGLDIQVSFPPIPPGPPRDFGTMVSPELR